MNTEEAINVAIAATIDEQAKPHRQPFNKLQASTAAAEFASGVADLSKSFGKLGSVIADMNKRIDQIAADVEFLQNSFETHPNRRLN